MNANASTRGISLARRGDNHEAIRQHGPGQARFDADRLDVVAVATWEFRATNQRPRLRLHTQENRE